MCALQQFNLRTGFSTEWHSRTTTAVSLLLILSYIFNNNLTLEWENLLHCIFVNRQSNDCVFTRGASVWGSLTSPWDWSKIFWKQLARNIWTSWGMCHHWQWHPSCLIMLGCLQEAFRLTFDIMGSGNNAAQNIQQTLVKRTQEQVPGWKKLSPFRSAVILEVQTPKYLTNSKLFNEPTISSLFDNRVMLVRMLHMFPHMSVLTATVYNTCTLYNIPGSDRLFHMQTMAVKLSL